MISGRSSIRCPSLRSPTRPAPLLSTNATGAHSRSASPTRRRRSRRAARAHREPRALRASLNLAMTSANFLSLMTIYLGEFLIRSWRRRALSTPTSIWPSARPVSAHRSSVFARGRRFSYRARTYYHYASSQSSSLLLRLTHVLTCLPTHSLTCMRTCGAGADDLSAAREAFPDGEDWDNGALPLFGCHQVHPGCTMAGAV